MLNDETFSGYQGLCSTALRNLLNLLIRRFFDYQFCNSKQLNPLRPFNHAAISKLVMMLSTTLSRLIFGSSLTEFTSWHLNGEF